MTQSGNNTTSSRPIFGNLRYNTFDHFGKPWAAREKVWNNRLVDSQTAQSPLSGRSLKVLIYYPASHHWRPLSEPIKPHTCRSSPIWFYFVVTSLLSWLTSCVFMAYCFEVFHLSTSHNRRRLLSLFCRINHSSLKENEIMECFIMEAGFNFT